MGGVNTVLLSRGTVEQVRRDCERCIRDAGKAGGYLLAACDMLPTETAPEKVRAMLECARTTGRYGG
jgi:uroporphyrinogen-III decarboxylase